MSNTKIIKYAIEQTVTVPLHYDGRDIDDLIETFAKGSDYMWCEEHEDLFNPMWEHYLEEK